MECLVSFVTRKPTGTVVRQDIELSVNVLRLGRGAENDVHLADSRVPLRSVEIRGEESRLVVQTVGPLDFRLNGRASRSAPIAIGDRIGLGPYDIDVATPPPGKDLALAVELVRPLGDDLERLRARSRTRLDRIGLGVAAWSWLAFVAVLFLSLGPTLFAAWVKTRPEVRAALDAGLSGPVLAAAERWWLAGTTAAAHGFFAGDCSSCHRRPFAPVRDETCLACHKSVAHHADPARFPMAITANRTCLDCHEEHSGRRMATLSGQSFCTSCHADLKALSPAATLLDATDFGIRHPEFRPTVVRDAVSRADARMTIGGPRLEEQSNLKYAHSKHGGAALGVRHPTRGMVDLACADCHAPDRDGPGMSPIIYDAHCRECHALKAGPLAPDRALPHAPAGVALAALEGALAEIALRDAPAGARRTRGGLELARASVAARMAEAQSLRFGEAACGLCHVVQPAGDGRAWNVAPVVVTNRWLPKARFDHRPHALEACTRCHDAPNSETAGDVLLPRIDSCRDCHGGERATDRIPSTCIDCHDFHIVGRPAIVPARR